MKKFEVKYLTLKFYEDYPATEYPEIEHKEERPYTVFLIKIENNMFAIPFRTNMNHKFGYKFKNSNRTTSTVTGLDFTKAVIVNNPEYIGENATVDNKEYLELSQKYFFIHKQFEKYVSDYHKYVSGELNDFQARAYTYSTLKYYHRELGI